MTGALAFIRGFLLHGYGFSLHILPPRFAKVRHYGLLANRGRAQRLEKVRAASAHVIERHIKVRGEANPYDTEYFEQRRCFICRVLPLGRTGKARAQSV